MKNIEVLKKFMKLAFNVEIKDSFTISCSDIYCPCSLPCRECPGNEDFWNEEFVGDVNAQINEINDNIQINNNDNERVAIKEISW